MSYNVLNEIAEILANAIIRNLSKNSLTPKTDGAKLGKTEKKKTSKKEIKRCNGEIWKLEK